MKQYLPLFLIGFTYSLYHCVGMCGGFVAAYSATCSLDRGDRRAAPAWTPHLLFNVGRVISYTIIGAAWGLAGSWANYYGHMAGTRIQGIAGVVGGTLMILFAISLVGLIRMPAGSMIGGSRVRKLFGMLLRSRSPWKTLPIGMLVGTVPCGLVYSMSSNAFAAGSPMSGAAVMAAFGSGTIPAMFAFGFASSCLSARLRKGMLTIAVVLTVIMGVEAIHRGLGAL